jgi:hypothetical protein
MKKAMSNKSNNEVRPNTRVYPDDLSEIISLIALNSAINSVSPISTNDDPNILSTIIDNTGSRLERLIPKGPPPEHISFFPEEPARRGDIIPIIDDDREFIIFIYWKNGEDQVHIDLDASFIGYGSDYSATDQVCSYYKPKGFRSTVHHSGDVRNAPNGASEFITFNLKNLKENNSDVNHVMAITQSYTNIEFDKIGDAIIGLGFIPKEKNGDGPNGCVVLSACRLTGKSTTNISGILHLSRTEGIPDTFEFLCINAHNSCSVDQSARSGESMIQKIAINFDIWRNSLNAPISQLEKEVIKAAAYNEVSYISQDGTLQIFHKNEGETSIEFYTRLMLSIVEK